MSYKIQLDPLRGTHDYTPPESEVLEWIIDNFKKVVESYGYRNIRTPIIERFELFALKSGEEIRRSMYVFKDKAGREIALRPEVTPSIVRVYLRQLQALPKPIRLYYIGPVFRYDEPQYARYREFTQAGVEILGGSDLYYDVELVMILEDFFDSIGLSKRVYKINDIEIPKVIARLGGLSAEEIDVFLHYMDKKMFEKVREMLSNRGRTAIEVLNKVIECRNILGVSELITCSNELIELIKTSTESNAAEIANYLEKRLERLSRFLELLKSINVGSFYVDLSFARGIAYYNGIIFEVEVPDFPVSIAGGGRYDNLTTVYGGQELASTGFAIGVERVMLALRKYSAIPIPEKPRVLVLTNTLNTRIVELCKSMRRCAVVQLELIDLSKLGRMLSYADRASFRYVVIIGPKEITKGIVQLRDLKYWKQEEVPMDEVPNRVCVTTT